MIRPFRPLVVPLALLCMAAISGCDWMVSANKRLASAEHRAAAGDDRGAAIDLQNALKSEPSNVQARLMLAEISLRLGDPKSALKELERANQAGAPADQTRRLAIEAKLALREFDPVLAQIDAGESGLQEPTRSTMRGIALLGKNDPGRALEAFKQALSVDAKDVQARRGLAEALAAQGNSSEALQELATTLEANPKDAAALLLKGSVLAARGEYAPAVEALKLARENAAQQLSSAQISLALAALTEARLATGDAKSAQASYAELAERAPSSPIVGLLAARLAMARQDYAAAVGEAQKVIAAVPDMLPAKMLLGSALLAQGNLNQAETQLADVVRQAPQNMEARKLLARINLQLERPDVALQVLSPVQQTDTADPQLDVLLGWANLQRGEGAKAVALLERSVAAQPNNAALKIDLAAAYLETGAPDKAEALLRSVAAQPGGARRNALLLAAVTATKGGDAAAAEVEQMVAAAPGDAAILSLASSFYVKQGQLSRAKDLLSQAAAKDPGNVNTLISLARVEMAAGDVRAAGGTIDKALAAQPANITARMIRVEVAARSGDSAGVGKRLEEIRAADAKAVEPRILLAKYYLQQKKPQAAEDVIRELRSQAQNDPAVASAIGRFYLDAGRFEEALNWFRTAAQKAPGNATHMLNVARAQLALGNNAAGRETLQDALRYQPGLLAANAALIQLDMRENRREAAMKRLAELQQAQPRDSAVATLAGDVAMSEKSYREAAQVYSQASHLAPSAALAVREFRARQLGGLPDPIAPLQAWLKQRPNDLAVRTVLAEAYAGSQQRERAIEQYEKVAAAERPSPMALNNLAWLYHENGDGRAKQLAQRAYAAAPQVPAVADTYGWILVKTGEVPQGLDILRKAVADSKAQPDIRYHYAAALALAGQREAARDELQALVKSDTKFASADEARKLLAELGT